MQRTVSPQADLIEFDEDHDICVIEQLVVDQHRLGIELVGAQSRGDDRTELGGEAIGVVVFEIVSEGEDARAWCRRDDRRYRARGSPPRRTGWWLQSRRRT